MSFVWDEPSPLQQLPAGPFQVAWQGKLLVRAPGKYRFHAQVLGKVELSLNGKRVLAGQTKADAEPQWFSGAETEIDYGQHPIAISFQSTGKRSQVKLYWSSDSFAFEPIPAGAYFLNEAHPEYDLETRGRDLFAAHRCNRCHEREHDVPSPMGPDLSHVGSGLRDNWIERWVIGDRPAAAHSRMPDFGFTREEAQAIGVYLRHQSTAVAVPAREVTKDPDNSQEGRKLFLSMGCLACHSHNKIGSDTPFGGGDLSEIGDKRSATWLWAWLGDPRSLNADLQMPVFQWPEKTNERGHLAAFLADSRAEEKREPTAVQNVRSTPELVEQGRKLVSEARCDACHRLNEKFNVGRIELSALDTPASGGRQSCLNPKTNRERWRPAYPQTDVPAIQAYLKSRAGPLAPEGAVEHGQRLLTWNNCLQCHPRDGGTGLGQFSAAVTQAVPDFVGQAPTLVPPRLNAVGDKLLDEYLRKAVAGEVKSRMPWLRVKMPRFKHTDLDRHTLTQFFIDHDRIQSAPKLLVVDPPIPEGKLHSASLAAGMALVGSQGFSCVACHQFGKFVPRNTAMGTRGSDLLQIDQRMRREFFLRWTRSPIRIVPDMEMPGYERPLPNILDGHIGTQLAALWASTNDPSSARLLDTSSVQQSLTVGSGEPARIIRDVFFIPKSYSEIEPRYLPRSFAVGLNSQHSVLFDLDQFVIRDWWQGGFARQKTEGKSWHWEVGGIRIASKPMWHSRISDLALVTHAGDTDSVNEVLQTSENVGQLIDYTRVENGVRFRYRLNAPNGVNRFESVEISEEWQPLVGQNPTDPKGWSRRITLTGKIENPQSIPVFVRPEIESPVGGGVNLPSLSSMSWQKLKGGFGDKTSLVFKFSEYAPLVSSGKDQVTGTFHYVAQPTDTPPAVVVPPADVATRESFATVPGYSATRLPLPRSIMPTAMTWTKEGSLALASLKGHIYTAKDTDNDGLEDKLDVFEEGLAAPYGIISDPQDGSLIVSQKPELVRLIDTDGDGRADLRKVFATGWGYNDNYHDWTCGIVRDTKGNLYVGLGSDYTQPKRPPEQQLWRGKILRISPAGKITPIASGLRYPTGLAMTPDDDLFVTDNQGEQNVFNELNHIVEGHRYGVPSREDPKDETPAATPAIQIPHPWTRSINGIFFLPRDAQLGDSTPHPFAGQGIGCEYDSRFLVRFSLQKVGDTFQGAIYPFSLDHVPPETPNFEGTLCGGVSPKGDIYIGCIHDSGWLGGQNVGSIVKLQSTGAVPLGIRELRATPHGFQIDFTAPVDRSAAEMAANYTISAYTRQWQGTYATPDSNRQQVTVVSATVSADGRKVTLQTDKLLEGYVYEISCGKIGSNRDQALWPATGHYTVNRVPVEK